MVVLCALRAVPLPINPLKAPIQKHHQRVQSVLYSCSCLYRRVLLCHSFALGRLFAQPSTGIPLSFSTPPLLFNFQDAETVGRVLSQIDKCNGYILGAHDTAAANTAAGSREGSVSSLFRTAFSDTHEPMFEKVGSVQERYMPGTYGAAVTPELELMVNRNWTSGGEGARGEEL